MDRESSTKGPVADTLLHFILRRMSGAHLMKTTLSRIYKNIYFTYFWAYESRDILGKKKNLSKWQIPNIETTVLNLKSKILVTTVAKDFKTVLWYKNHPNTTTKESHILNNCKPIHEYQFQSINVSVNFSKFADIHASVNRYKMTAAELRLSL